MRSGAEKEAGVRGAWGDFARLCPGEEGVDGRNPPADSCAHCQGVGAAGRGRQCSLRCSVKGGPPGGNTKARGGFDGGSGVPFFICAWEVCLKRAAPGAASGSLHSPYPHPSLPGHGAGITGHREPGHRLGAVRLSAEPACVRGKVRGSCRGVACAGREVVPGDWDAGRPGGQAAGGVRSQGARARWERVWRGLCALRLG